MRIQPEFDFEIEKISLALLHSKVGLLCYATNESSGQAVVSERNMKSLPHGRFALIDASKSNGIISKTYIQNLSQSH
jgi:hypothetical protein